MKLTRTIGKAAGTGAAVVATLLLAFTFLTDNNTGTAVPAPAPNTANAPTDPARVNDAVDSPSIALLDEIPIAADAPAAKYDRDLFGQRWADVDRNGCDTRNDLLGQRLVDPTFKPGTRDCVVLTGTLHDPYTGETVTFTRISEGYQPVQVDHIIPLAAAWVTGAAEWTNDKRMQFANDPSNLQITTANQIKGDSTPSNWLPEEQQSACDYSARYVRVAHAYELTLAVEDVATLRTTLLSCTPTT